MKLKLLFPALLILHFQFAFSQAPEIQWQNTIGGNSADYLYSVNQTSDGGFILGGYGAGALTGDWTEVGNGGVDFWVIKLDSFGEIEWQNAIGGSDADYLYVALQTAEGGYLLGGASASDASGDKSEANMGFPGSRDFWIVKIDSLGLIEWENTIGGDDQDLLATINQTSDGGYLLGGYSASGISGDKAEDTFIGGIWGYDYWVVKINSSGDIEWQNTIGGTGDDWLRSAKQTNDGGYILGGYSNSGISGDKTEPVTGLASFYDYWIIKLENEGNIIWQNTIGGDLNDNLFSIDLTSDDGFILGGYSESGISGDKAEEAIGFHDYWVIKLNSSGEIMWQNTIGGFSDDWLYAVEQTIDGGYICGGSSNSSTSPDKTDPAIGTTDYWVVKLNSIGGIEWDNVIGSNGLDDLNAISQTADNGFILGGYSEIGLSGDKTELGNGHRDYWVVKLLPEDCITMVYYADADEDGFGNHSDSVSACVAPVGYITESTDCNDLNAGINPDASEICNDIDDDCNFIADDGLPVYTYYLDADEDGYGDLFTPITTCYETPPVSYVLDNTDCDDTEDLIHESIIYYTDLDGDLYGDLLNSEFFCSIFPPVGFVTNNLDCDDFNIFINPVSNEACNNMDDNCNGEADEDLIFQILYEDFDNDNYGNSSKDSVTCMIELPGFISDSTDCDDTNPDIYPGAPELLNGYDDNCNNLIDEGLAIEDFTEQQFIIYPIPTSQELTIDFTEIVNGKLTIYDLTGRIIDQYSIAASTFKLNISNYASGMYFIKININGEEQTEKFIKN